MLRLQIDHSFWFVLPSAATMNCKVVCFFLILSLVIAVTTADYEDELFFEDLMEKRGRRPGRGRKLSYERTFPLNKNLNILAP